MLLTYGENERQQAKIKLLELEPYEIIITQHDKKKEFVEPYTSLANNRACIFDDFLVEQSQVWEE